MISAGETNYSGHGWEDIDPTVFIDDDGQAYLFWGNNALYCVKLNDDMISYLGDIIVFDIKDKAAFGPDFEEAPWLFKRKGLYYLLYASSIPEAICYATSNTPIGPWEYGGVVMDAMKQGCGSNHPGYIEYNGNHYFFYHYAGLPNGIDKCRSVAIQQFKFYLDGTIPKIKHTEAGVVKSVYLLNPYQKTEAETIAFSEGVKAAYNSQVGVFVNANKDGSYIKVKDVDFRSKGASEFTARVGTTHNVGVTLEIRTDSKEGLLLGTIDVPLTGGDDRWTLQTTDIQKVTGVHDLYFVFRGDKPGRLMYFDYWVFR